ncbi:hypothetical protein PG987_011613 [Apiospora arundinis]
MAVLINAASSSSSTPSPRQRTPASPLEVIVAMLFTVYLLLGLLCAAALVKSWANEVSHRSQIQIESQQGWLLPLKLILALIVAFVFAFSLIVAHTVLQLLARWCLDNRIFTVDEKLQDGVLPYYHWDSPVITLDELLEHDERDRNCEQHSNSDRPIVRLLKWYIDLPPVSHVPPYVRMSLPPPMAPIASDFVSTTPSQRVKKHTNMRIPEEGLLWGWLERRNIQRKKRREAEPLLPLYKTTQPTVYDSMDAFHVPATLQAPDAAGGHCQEGFLEVNL